MPLTHRDLDVYRHALHLTRAIHRLTRSLPRGHRHIRDQLHRATHSICLNIAEGAGEIRPLEKARFYRMAKRSALESGAALDVIRIVQCDEGGAEGDGSNEECQVMLERIVSMLTRLSMVMEGRGEGGG